MSATTIFKVLTTCRRTSCKIRAGFYQEKARGGHIVQCEGPTPLWKPLKTLLHLVWCPVWSRGSSRQVHVRKNTQNTMEFFSKCLTLRTLLWYGFSIAWLLTLVRQRLWKPDVSSTHCVIIAGTRGSMTTTDLHLPRNPTSEWVSAYDSKHKCH